ncbi:MAG: ABC transporter ATP-binding protein [Geodermatophilaceae bacterium]|nr:ABC transporter ATP-binding protein [Geodermatophilaceae bacterium]
MNGHLRLEGLTLRYGPRQEPALADVDLDVVAGSSVAILGPSGSGKSTLLRLTAGLEEPTAGTVVLDGVDLSGTAAEKRGMAMVFQRPLLFPHLDVADNVAFADRVRGVSRRAARRRAREFLDLVQLPGFDRRAPRSLSGGQEQRVALARALAAEPRVLLLDEPFSALDTGLREEMYELLDELRLRLAPTVLLVTHDHREADALGDTVAVLDGGRLLQSGPMRRLYTRPVSLAVSRLLGGRNEIAGQVRDGWHHSALGALRVTTPVANGPGVLVVRQEAVQLTAPDAVDADAPGTVVRVRRRGPRALITVEVGERGPVPPARVTAELGPGPALPVGRDVGVLLPVEELAVVAADPDAAMHQATEVVESADDGQR